MKESVANGTTPVAIIGGGITGLSTAWYLQRAGIPYTLLEASPRWGGKIQTDHIDSPLHDSSRHGSAEQPFILERAGDAFLAAQKPWAMELAYELGLEDEILPTNTAPGPVYVVKDGELHPLPKGLQLIIPTDREALLASPLLSDAGKARMLQEESIPPRAENESAADEAAADESVAQFVRRRLGDEALEMLAEPLICGIYNADPEEQSMGATFARFPQLEQRYGSLIAGARAAQKARAAQPRPSNGAERPSTAFISFRNGTETLPRTLAERLTGDLRLGTAVNRIDAHDDGYTIELSSGSPVSARHVVVTVPARPAAALLRALAPDAATGLETLRTVSTGVVFLAFRRDEVAHPLDSFGVLMPAREGRPVNALTMMTTKFDHRAPEGAVLLRVFFGGVRSPQTMQCSDEQVVTIARDQLRELLGINAQPILHRVYRWIDAQPQYDVGHNARMDATEAALPPGVHIAGSPYRGVGIPDCVRQAREVAEKIASERCTDPDPAR